MKNYNNTVRVIIMIGDGMHSNININLIVKSIVYKSFSEEIINEAIKMDFNLVNLCYNMIDSEKPRESFDAVLNALCGIYGNIIATKYFRQLGYEVKNEYPIYDKKGKKVTMADVFFVDKNNTCNYCEVKAATQIILNDKAYINTDLVNGYFSGDLYVFNKNNNPIIKYKMIAKKLIRQVKNLSLDKNGIVNVIIFNGCNFDEKLKIKLEKMNVNIIILPTNINDLINYLSDLLGRVYTEIKNTIVNTNFIQ